MNLPDFIQPPKAIAIDLDGTLLNSKTELSERSRSALEQCLTQDIPVIIATSRPARIFNRIFPQDLASGCSQVIMNGAIAKGNPPLSGYFREMLPDDTARGIIALSSEFHPDIRITVELDGYEFGANWIAEPATLWQRNSATPDMVLTIEESLSRQPSKIALGGIGTDILKLTQKLLSNFGNTISVVPALLGNPLLNVTTSQASKPHVLRKLLNPRRISLIDVVAFGDDMPDLDMLQECGLSVAMGNAFPEVKTACDYQTASNDDDGVAIILEKMLEIFK